MNPTGKLLYVSQRFAEKQFLIILKIVCIIFSAKHFFFVGNFCIHYSIRRTVETQNYISYTYLKNGNSKSY